MLQIISFFFFFFLRLICIFLLILSLKIVLSYSTGHGLYFKGSIFLIPDCVSRELKEIDKNSLWIKTPRFLLRISRYTSTFDV